MSDPYLYEEVPVLKNKLGIKNEQTLDRIEAEQSRANMMLLYEQGFQDFSPDGLREIHRTLFDDIYEWAGQYRIINIEKREKLLAGRSVWYSNEDRIEEDLDEAFGRLRTAHWNGIILTLFAIAKELEKSGNISPMVEADLAVGLPPEHYALRQRFADYFKRGRVNFVFNGAPICLMIRHVFVYPQAYAAVVPQAGRLKEIPRTFIIDIGGYTTDVMLLRNASPDLQFCRSLEMGVIPMSNDIISRVSAMYDIKIEDDHIADIIQGRPTILPQEVREVVFMKVRSYACDILDKLRELQVDLRANPAIFIGGGSILFRSFVEESPLVAHADFVTDPKANAIGYGMLATAQLRRMTPQNHGGEFFAQG